MFTKTTFAALIGTFALSTPVWSAIPTKPLQVVASFSIIADMAQQVGAQRIHLKTLVQPGGDVHVYEPTPADAVALGAADVILANGLAFEAFLPRLVTASHAKAPITLVSNGVHALQTDHARHSHSGNAPSHDKHGHTHHGKYDPHAWQSVPNAQRYVTNIAQAFCKVDTEGCDTYKKNAHAYNQKLHRLDQEIRDTIAKLPARQRTVITSHGAFNYFQEEYGITFLSAEGVSTETEASAADIARLIRQIKQGHAAAIFFESITNPRLIEQIARETDIQVGGTLYSDSLSGQQGPASTYLNMMRINLTTIKLATTQAHPPL